MEARAPLQILQIFSRYSERPMGQCYGNKSDILEERNRFIGKISCQGRHKVHRKSK